MFYECPNRQFACGCHIDDFGNLFLCLFGNEHALSVSDVQGLKKGGFVIASLFLKETCRVSLGMFDERGGVTDGYF